MAKYESKYKELTFFVGNTVHKFNGGTFSTEDAEVIKVLSRVSDARRIDEPKKEAPKTEAKPKATKAPKKSTARKTSEK